METDRDALVALYDSADGDNWQQKDNWLSNLPLEEWHGVNTDDSGRVSFIDLSSNELSGELPPELGNLAKLGTLHLQGNQFRGQLPPSGETWSASEG